MNYNERGADPQAGVAQNPRVGTESGDLGKIRETIGLLRSILDAQGCWGQGSGMEISEEASGKSRGI